MLSRVAENLYWLSRYIERAENLARLLDVGFDLELDAMGLADPAAGEVGPLETIMTVLSCRKGYKGTDDPDEMLPYLTFDRSNPQSILSMIALARENARGTQESVSAEAWSEVNRLYLFLSGSQGRQRFSASPPRFFERVKRSCILIGGLVDSTLPRDEVFHFLQVGRYLERADQMTRIVAARAHTLHEPEPGTTVPPMRLVGWTSLLRSCSAHEAYLRTYRDRVDPESVVRYLLLDPEFPRALRFCVDVCRDSLHEISGGDEDGYGSEAERLLGRLDGELRYIDVHEIFDRGLGRFLAGVQFTCTTIGEEIHRAYFSI